MPKTRSLLLVTALAEAGVGVALLVAPGLSVELLLGKVDESPPPFVMERILGAALFVIAITCWLARDGTGGGAAKPLLAGLLVYNVAVPALLAYAALSYAFSSLLLWPACVLHAGLTVWCVVCLRAAASAANGPARTPQAHDLR
ncbi:MAG: hypothetical protein U0836_18885 [Pirellulales bacterium]